MFGNGPKAADVNQGQVADCYTLDPLKAMGGIIPKNAASDAIPAMFVDGRKLTPEDKQKLKDFSEGKLGHRSKIIAPGASDFRRVKAKLQPVDAKKSICTPDMHIGIDLASGPDRTVMHKVSGPVNSPVGRYAPIDYSKRVSWDNTDTDIIGDLKRFRESTNAAILRDLEDLTDVSYRQFHDTRGHFVHGVYFKTCYGMRMPVVVLAGFNPAPPKPKARDKRRRWHDED